MKRVLAIFFFVLMFCIVNVNACSVEIQPLRKIYRQAKSVFLGKVLNIVDYSPTEKDKASIPESWRDWKIFSKVTFEIKNKWKGKISQRQEFLAVAYFPCGCPNDGIAQFKEGEEFLVFAREKKFIPICEAEKSMSEITKESKKLNSFWFRTWATSYPF